MKNKTNSKAQVAIEFLVILGALIFFVVLFFISIQINQEDKLRQQQTIKVKEVALTVQNELNLAQKSSEGYTRTFEIPEKISGQDYDITLDTGVVYIKTSDDKNALTLPIPEVTGNVNKSTNTIQKINGVILLNQ